VREAAARYHNRQTGGREEIRRILYAKDLVRVFRVNPKTFGIAVVAKWIMGSPLLDHLDLPDD